MMQGDEAEKLIEDLLREVLYGSREQYEDVVEELRAEGSTVRVRLRGDTPDFEVAINEDEQRDTLLARLERKLRIAREGPDRSVPPLEA